MACEHFFWNALTSTNCTTALLGPPQWGIKREKKSFRSIDPLSRIPRALDLTRSAIHALCSVHIQCADRKSSVHCICMHMPCSKKTRLKLLRGGRAPTAPPLGSASDISTCTAAVAPSGSTDCSLPCLALLLSCRSRHLPYYVYDDLTCRDLHDIN